LNLASAKLFFRPPDRERGPAVLHPEEAEPVDCIAWKLTATTPSWRFKDKARPAAKPVVQRAVTASVFHKLCVAVVASCCLLLARFHDSPPSSASFSLHRFIRRTHPVPSFFASPGPVRTAAHSAPHDLLYFLPRQQSVNAIRHLSRRLISPSCFIKALDFFDTGIFEFSSFRIPRSE
jgi:hypothetical protein